MEEVLMWVTYRWNVDTKENWDEKEWAPKFGDPWSRTDSVIYLMKLLHL